MSERDSLSLPAKQLSQPCWELALAVFTLILVNNTSKSTCSTSAFVSKPSMPEESPLEL